MATIDPNIALGVKPLQLENPLNAFAQMSQIQAYQRQNELANRAVEQEDALNRAYASSMNPQTGEIDPNKLRQNIAGANLGSKLPAVEKSLLDTRKVRSEVEAKEFENKRTKLERSITDVIGFDTHDQILGSLASKVESGELDKPTAQQLAASVPQDPRLIPSWQIKTARRLLSAKDQLEQQFTSQDNNGVVRVIATPKYAGGGGAQVVPGSQMTKVMSPSERAADARARERLTQEGQAVTYQVDADNNVVALPSKLPAGAVPTARAVIAPGGGMQPLKGKDASKTAVSEQQASYNIGRVLTAAKQINEISKKDPSALKPGGTEALASAAGFSGTANAARDANRQIVYGAQRDSLDALLYLATGAAYNKEQLEGQMTAYIPQFTDEPETVAAKKTRMAELIKSAKARAGKAWTPEMESAMQSLSNPAPAPTAPAGPKAGVIQDGYRFKGGNPADPKSWEKV